MVALSFLIRFTYIAAIAYMGVAMRNMEYNNSRPMPKGYSIACAVAMCVGAFAQLILMLIGVNALGIGNVEMDATVGLVAILLLVVINAFKLFIIPAFITFVACKANDYCPETWITVMIGVYCPVYFLSTLI